LNEEVDPQVIIRQLKAQVASLTEELAIARGDVVRVVYFIRERWGGEICDYVLDVVF
jgi:hypothetical protein